MFRHKREFFLLSLFIMANLSLISPAEIAGKQPQEQKVSPEEIVNSPLYVSRRTRLMENYPNSLMIIPSQFMSRLGLRENLNFFYLTGLREPETWLVLETTTEVSRTILFRPQQRRPDTSGAGAGPAVNLNEGKEFSRLEKSSPRNQIKEDLELIVKPLEEFSPYLRSTISQPRRLYFPFSALDFLAQTFGLAQPLSQAEALYNLDPILSEMRLTKDDDEIQALREAIDLTAEALNEAYRAVEPGMREIDLAAIIKYIFNRKETRESFLQVASGPNSTHVHFGATSRSMKAGDLIVFDAGVYIRGYTSDISRTIPVSGRFTKEQREIYELVLRAQKEGCRRLVAGVTFKAVQDEVEKILMVGLEKLGLVTDINSLWQRRLYIQHGFGHAIGLEVHDVWSWHGPRLDKINMKPGMVMTMEPGLYFPEKRLETYLESLNGKVPEAEIEAFRNKVAPVYARYAGFGVRIEDDILITEDGNEILSVRVPKEIAEIERLMREKSLHNLIKIKLP